MLATADNGKARGFEQATTRRHPLEKFVPDPGGTDPLCGEAEFVALLDGIVADFAPRVFAVVQEFGDRVDARVAAWGLAFDDRAEVVPVEGGWWMSLRAPEDALRGFRIGTRIRARVVWFNPNAATRPQDAEPA